MSLKLEGSYRLASRPAGERIASRRVKGELNEGEKRGAKSAEEAEEQRERMFHEVEHPCKEDFE